MRNIRSFFALRKLTLGPCRAGSSAAGSRLAVEPVDGKAWRRRVVGLLLAVVCGWQAVGGQPRSALGEDSSLEHNLLQLGSSQAAMETWYRPGRFLWDNQPLRSGVQDLAVAHDGSLWFDRRLDPNQAMTYHPSASASDSATSLFARLQEVVRQARAEVGLVENVLYVGPAGSTGRIQRAAVELHDTIERQLPDVARASRGLQWQELTTSQALLEQIAASWQIEVIGQLPHDLLHAGSLPEPTSLATQLTLICGGFDLEVELADDRRFRLIPLREQATWQTTYAKSQVRGAIGQVQRTYPDGRLNCRGNVCVASGVTNFHIGLLIPPAAARAATQIGSQKVWSFEIDNLPVEHVFQGLASGIGFEVVWDPACTAAQKKQLISLKVVKAPFDQLLQQVCDSAGLACTVEAKVVTLRPK